MQKLEEIFCHSKLRQFKLSKEGRQRKLISLCSYKIPNTNIVLYWNPTKNRILSIPENSVQATRYKMHQKKEKPQLAAISQPHFSTIVVFMQMPFVHPNPTNISIKHQSLDFKPVKQQHSTSKHAQISPKNAIFS